MSRVVALVGPTASGKSDIGLRLAEELEAEILSVDSMQVYMGMDIGTAKPSPEERARVPHHLIDLVEPEEPFSVAEFQQAGRAALESLGDESPALIVGGSGLHFRAIVDPLEFPPTDEGLRTELEELEEEEIRAELEAADPQATEHVDLANRRRLVRAVEILRLTGLTPSARRHGASARAVRRYRPLIPFTGIGIDPGEGLEQRVTARLQGMLARGLLEEVEQLADRLGPTARQAVGYKELLPALRGRRDLEAAVDEARRATLELARRQRRYFGRDPRLRWIPWSEDPDVRLRSVMQALEERAAWIS